MAKQLSYIHPNGTSYPESYWRITKLDVNVPERIALFYFNGYKDAAARLDNKEPIGTRIVAITDSDFDQRFQEVTLKEKNPQEVGYEYSTEFKDIPTTEIITINETDQNGQPIELQQEITVNVSFFENSIDC